MATVPARRGTDLDPVTIRVLLLCVTTVFIVVWLSLLAGVVAGSWQIDDVRSIFTLLLGVLAGWIAPSPKSLGLGVRPSASGGQNGDQ